MNRCIIQPSHSISSKELSRKYTCWGKTISKVCSRLLRQQNRERRSYLFNGSRNSPSEKALSLLKRQLPGINTRLMFEQLIAGVFPSEHHDINLIPWFFVFRKLMQPPCKNFWRGWNGTHRTWFNFNVLLWSIDNSSRLAFSNSKRIDKRFSPKRIEQRCFRLEGVLKEKQK
jgi:hypothetical protein